MENKNWFSNPWSPKNSEWWPDSEKFGGVLAKIMPPMEEEEVEEDDEELDDFSSIKVEEFGRFYVDKLNPYVIEEETEGRPEEQDKYKQYGMQVAFRFRPNKKKVMSTEIAFVQIIRNINVVTGKVTELVLSTSPFYDRLTDDKWFLDRAFIKADDYGNPPIGYKFAWYGYDNNGFPRPSNVKPGNVIGKKRKNAEFYDKPNASIQKKDIVNLNETWEFELFVAAKEGTDRGLIYGGIAWGFSVKGSDEYDIVVTKNEVTKIEKNEPIFYPNLEKCIIKWNEQARVVRGDSDTEFISKNHPEQESIQLKLKLKDND